MATLAEIRARLQAQENKTSFVADNSVYQHWNMPTGATSRLRFLPDGDTTNDYFWVEKLQIRLPFSGVVGVSDKPTTVNVPCVEMWGETCPILSQVRPWYKDDTLKDLANKYWKKRSYILQGFVREGFVDSETPPENPIRRFVISPQIFPLIKAALLDPEVEEFPTSYDRGLDFSIIKTEKGGYADYGTSKWSRRESALTDLELEAIEKFGLFDLKDFLPKKPTAGDLEVISEMFAASVDGLPYDPSKWSAFYRPVGVDNPNRQSSGEGEEQKETRTVHAATKPVTTQTVKPVVKPPVVHHEDDSSEEPETVIENPAPQTKSTKSEDILAMIRNRNKK